MKEQPLISIIIPVYNAERYLRNCIDSLLNQTYFQIEIILVNDGSMDDSGEICDSYKSIDKRIKVVHLENGGVSRARNKGLDLCSGDYVCFIDSDDTVDSDYIKNFKDSIETGIDIYIQGTKIIKENGAIDTIIYDEFGIKTIDDIFNANNLCGHGYVACKMYNASLLKDNKISFNEDIRFSEDLLFILECLLYTDRIKYIDNVGYNYYLRDGNASSKEYPFEMELKCWEQYSLLIKQLSLKYNIDIIKINKVAEIYAMLFARVRNAMYDQNLCMTRRSNVYNCLTYDAINILYKYRYISNKAVQIGYLLLKFRLLKIMDTYFSIIYKLKNR